MTELLQSHDKTVTAKLFLEMESTPGEHAMKIVEMTTKHLEYYINLVDKAVAEFKKIDSNYDTSSTVDKKLSNSIICYREVILERKTIDTANFIVTLF